MTKGDSAIYGSFDGPEAAAQATEGKVHAIDGVDPRDAFLVTDAKGRSFAYVHVDYRDYRKVAERMAGERVSMTGHDTDHVASKKTEARLGNNYVLLARVPSSANRSAGSVEKITALDRQFNHAAQPQVALDQGFGRATPLSHRQMQKLKGRLVADYDRSDTARDDPLADAKVAHALMQGKEEQARIAAMRGPEITRYDPQRLRAQAEPVSRWQGAAEGKRPDAPTKGRSR